MNAQFIPTEQDFVNVNLFLCSLTPRIRKQMNAQKYVGRFIFSILLLICILRFIQSGSFFQLIVTIASVFAILFYHTFNLWIYKKQISRKFRKMRNRGAVKVVNIQLDAENLILSENSGEYKVKTEKLLGFFEVSDYFYLQINQEVLLSLPKRPVDPKLVREELQSYAKQSLLPYRVQLDWSTNIYSKKGKVKL